VLIVLVAWIAGVLTLPVFAMAVAGFLTVWLSFWSVACVALVLFVAGAWTTVAREGKASNIAGAVLLSLFAAPFLGFWVFGMTMLAQQTVFWTPFVLGLACILFVVYAILLPAPTVEGRRIMDGIEGFALYLRGGSDPAHRGVSRGIDADEFERWLPYAVALDASENWEAYFGGVVESKLREEDERELAERATGPTGTPSGSTARTTCSTPRRSPIRSARRSQRRQLVVDGARVVQRVQRGRLVGRWRRRRWGRRLVMGPRRRAGQDDRI
jgi:hypothetical protein